MERHKKGIDLTIGARERKQLHNDCGAKFTGWRAAAVKEGSKQKKKCVRAHKDEEMSVLFAFTGILARDLS